ncbi:methylated-DNA--[protein]-cysteine S-methyltransferase [Mycobacterium montefiorense]|uniref:Methylated-DNA--protein-cysteine methyltransferase n=1 Tax=Mycobacterium montefiorense TaxID=154654 RepID=A0AA37PK74_9MYCO|nr:methylated-DNA--[protein]-cysteine S-methyltransferase [Mycobacterium montefiorense]GBG39166.1 methylated-DNA--protein-cysteine methyltransferase [Mycobacterium montefiorense]GKU37361.1 methylated-DNA--protein-cysteine methyltransferase [Mycobacterium montefiorense]GKU42009.1 methylated-DNA--protein-cysteine methyltransferase [Mycobacterium montefiorense]GKU45529.1 methylated-DNA--protein-cysteine methyltransferase [Mycobacterium montefiorense]GKU53509.1 methylated-DNA--protein-cysteine met
MTARHTMIESPLGELTLVADGALLTGVYFRHHWHPPTADTLGEFVEPAADELFGRTGEQLREYLAGERTQFDLPMALMGDPRRHRVWDLLTDIGYGRTKTYGELAAELADGTTAYEVGQAVGRNSLSIVVPCHRVVGKDGALTGYAGGLKRKRFLLELEEPAPAVAGRLF